MLAQRIVLLVASLASGWPIQGPQRQTKIIDYVAAPKSLDEEVRRADLIILGQVASSRQTVDETNEIVPTPTIEHQVQVLEVLKGDSALRGQSIVINQSGGVAVLRGKEIYVDDRSFPVFRGRQKLILMLDRNPNGTYEPAWGPASAYEVVGDQVKIPIAAKASEQRKSLFTDRRTVPLDDVLQLIRTRVGK